MRIFRHYKNGQIYDPTNSKFVSLKDLAKLAKNGKVFKIRDDKNDIITKDILVKLVKYCKYNLSEKDIWELLKKPDLKKGKVNEDL